MGWLEDLQNNRIVRSVVHQAREWENELDTDHDGSIADQVGRDLHENIPIIGGLVGHPLENAGDLLTDVMGTRDQGIFSERGTLDVETTTDTDYGGDGINQDGIGQSINDMTGMDIDPAVPAAIAAGMCGPAVGWAGAGGIVANEVLHNATRAFNGRVPEVPSLTGGAADIIRGVPEPEQQPAR